MGDWGTGLYGAPEIAKAILKDADPFMMLMHLGDVYYAGTKNEMKERFLDLWPERPEAIHRALNSNHDMYSGGKYYFENALPAFGQDASYFAHQNKDWTLIGLHVAHTDHAIDDGQVKWVEGILRQAGDRKVSLRFRTINFSLITNRKARSCGRIRALLKSSRASGFSPGIGEYVH